ncbi:MAG: hypothetical protein CFH22_00435 [Alphaproteobacteria bacterium MarineAlpha5_Bin12]|mgnify:FL=1|nr:preprotein translocase subunit YajC [Pelagibacteraceae bacterium]PPR41888.1 MAG: hypothetical protein CFH22_00435 [Alphaproteobacteria bacterium MarineAlpha5_Bin12]|tara:strand:+ start:3662 stop:3997 length:336 start_codon:yes stop_codon:yes gene_type:complete
MEQFGTLIPLILIFLVFWFLLIRPQQKKIKQHREMVQNLKRGDKIVTSGGIIGKIVNVNETKEITLEISENINVQIAPGMISDLLEKKDKTNTPTNDGKNKNILSGMFGKK